jgi:hypothetical protein
MTKLSGLVEKAIAIPYETPEVANYGPLHDSATLDKIAASLAEICVLLKKQTTTPKKV